PTCQRSPQERRLPRPWRGSGPKGIDMYVMPVIASRSPDPERSEGEGAANQSQHNPSDHLGTSCLAMT
ncbi:MAG: hypothetical protein KAS54_00240, partial [Dehalococcoidia bacterium]|nr:hypothetical protein [Dehalococcoidia bacterium]